ncbi:MAG: MFS transporter [Anaerolineae bacterium]
MAKNERTSKTVGYFGAYVGIGLSTAILGPTLPGLARQTQSQLGEIGSVFTAMALGYLVGSVLGGRLYDRVPGHPVMAGGLVIMAASLAVTPGLPQLWLLVGAVLLLGAAAGAVDVGGNTLLVWVYGREVGPYMSALHFFFGLGSFLSPIVVAQVMRLSDGIGGAYWMLAVLMLPVGLWLFRVSSPAAPAYPADGPREHSPENHNSTQSDVRLLVALLVVLFFLYVGAEAGFGGWIYTYAVALDLSAEATAAYLTSAFWGALTVGRLLSVPLAARMRPSRVLLADLAGCLVSVGVLLLWPSSLAATWLGTCGLGFSMASIFPTLLSLAERRMMITGQTTGWFLAGSSVGGMFLPWLMGKLFESLGPWGTMVAVGVDLVAALGVFGILMAYSMRQRSLSGRGFEGPNHDGRALS